MINLLPRDERFFDELEALAQYVKASTREFQGITSNLPEFDAHLSKIEQHRLSAKEVYKSSLVRLDKAFITPLDREDILNLITQL